MSVTQVLSASKQGRLRVRKREEDGDVILSLHGELDLGSSALLRKELKDAEDAAPRRIVLDLSRLGFIDSSGLSELIAADYRAQSGGYALVLTRPPRHARRLFRLTGVDAELVME